MPPEREPSPLDTTEYTFEEIVARLELGRLQVEATEDGSRLVVTHAEAPPQERRRSWAHGLPVPGTAHLQAARLAHAVP